MQTVHRLLDIIEILSTASNQRLKDIAKISNLNKSTAHRFLKTLIDQGYVYKNEVEETYNLTFKIVRIGKEFMNHFNINSLARPYLEKISAECGETLHLTALNNNSIVYIDKIEAKNKSIIVSSFIGKSQPLHSTASGKIFLSYMDSEEFNKVWSGLDLTAKTKYTIVNKKDMLAELKNIRSQGYAIDNQENEEGIACISAPVFNIDNKAIYAISITIPLINNLNNYKEKLLSFLPILQENTLELSKKLGSH
ncbi:MAG: IclR family transcriptional regulator [Alphaproteobacteria bacterium]|jgi:DNA-binding IclR family transcriptional regulator|nr:IclR family transcriptional regulator [Alphaproteobacteria bacterium]